MKTIRNLTTLFLLLLATISIAYFDSTSVAERKEDATADIHIGQQGILPDKSPVNNQNDLEDDISLRSTDTTIPSSYDAREDGIVPSARNQGAFSNCWAFAALGSSESNLLKRGIESPDFSELHLSYLKSYHLTDPLNLTTEDFLRIKEKTNEIYSVGSTADAPIEILSQWKGAVLEELAPYTSLTEAAPTDFTNIPDSQIYNDDIYHLVEAEKIYINTPNRVKKKVLEKGGVFFTYHAPESTDERNLFANEDYTAYCSMGETILPNHAVLLVGWDDNYPVSNFNPESRPENPGAWLIRNSWGPNVHDNGFLWISYEDASLQNFPSDTVAFSMESADNYDNNYQYDSGLSTSFTSEHSAMANIFTTQHKESLQAVSIETGERDVDYEINVYKVTDKSNPESGIKLGDTITGNEEERGYHTIDFSELGFSDIPLEKGDTFSVVVKMKDSEGKNSFLPYEVSGFTEFELGEVHAEKTESFLYNGTWKDMIDNFDANVRIKAFTKVDTSISCENISLTPGRLSVKRGKTTIIPYLLTPTDTTDGIVTWRSSDDSVATVSNGIVYGKGSGTAEITGTINGHSISVMVDVSEVLSENISIPETLSLYQNQRVLLDTVIYPEDSTDTFSLTSSDPSKVFIINNKYLFGIADTDNTPVTVTATTESGKTAECQVTVKAKNPYDVTLDDMQSLHPYLDDMVLYYEFARKNAIGYRVTFSPSTHFEDLCDYLYLLDSSDEIIASYTGDDLSGKTITINESKIRLSLSTDPGLTQYGFKVTEIVPIYATPTPSAGSNPSTAPAVSPKVNPAPTAQKPITKKLTFKAKKKTVKVGKKINLSKYLKITKNRKGKVSISYQFTKKKFKKYASLSKKGVLKAKKKGIGKTLYVKAKASDGSKKSAKIKIVIKKK